MIAGIRNITVAVAFLILSSCILILDVRGIGGEIVCFTYLLLSGFNLLEGKKNTPVYIGVATSIFILIGWGFSLADELFKYEHLCRAATLLATWMLVAYFRTAQKPEIGSLDQVIASKLPWQKRFRWIAIIILLKITGVAIAIYLIFINYLEEKMVLRESKSLHALTINKMHDLELLYSDVLFLSSLQDVHNLGATDEVEKDFARIIEFRKVYDQIRLLDTNGYERVRVNAGEKPEIVEENKLQFKGSRDYFKASVHLPENYIYISPITLNQENGKIEYPEKPVMRVATPIFNSDNKRQGLLIINYLTSHLETFATKLDNNSVISLLLFDNLGKWLSQSSNHKASNNRSSSLKKMYPEIWEKLKTSKIGEVSVDGDRFLFEKVSMDDAIKTEFENSYFKVTNGTSGLILLKQIPKEVIAGIHYENLGTFLLIYGLILLVFLMITKHIYRQRLSESLANLKFESILNNTHSFIGLLDLSGTLVEANNTALQFAESKREDLIGLKFWDCPWWQVDDKTKDDLKEAVKTASNGDFVRYDVNVVSGSGHQITIDFSLRPVFDNKGNQICIIPEGHDISEKEKLQKELHDTNKQFKEIKKIARIGAWRVDLNEMTAKWDKQIYDIHEIEEGTPIKVEEGINFYREDFRPVIQKSINDAIEYKKPWDVEAILITAKGREVWVRAIGYPVYDNGELVELRGTFLDIDNLKQSQIEAQDNKRRMELAVNSAKLGVWDWNIKENILHWDKSMYTIYDVDESEFTGAYDAWEKTLLEEDKEVANKAVQDALDNLKPLDTKFRIVSKDGSIRHVTASAAVIFDENGAPERMIGINMDITDRWESEQKIKELNLSLEKKVEERTGQLLSVQNELKQQLGLLDSSALISITDANGVITSVNDTFCAISGYSRNELIGRNHRLLKSGKQSQALFDGMWKTISSGITWKGEICNRRKDGTFYWVSTVIQPFTNDNGEIDKYVSVRFDITNVKEANEKLRLLNEKLSITQNELEQQFHLLDSSLIISTTNTDGEIVDVNDTLCSISGYSRQELIGQNHRILMTPKYGVKFNEIWNTISSGRDWKGEICNTRKDGSEYWVDLYIKPFFTPQGEIEKFVSIRYDITEMKLVQQKILEQSKKLELANKKLDVVNKELETFSYSVSHDLKAPLRALQGFSKNLVSKYGDQLDETGIRWLTFIRDNAEQMDSLIRDMLNFSRINKKNLKKVDVNMTDMINQQIEHFKNEYENDVNITLGNIEPVKCDYVMMETVWQNLIGNAFKYSHKKPVIDIEIGSEARNGHVHFFIKDNGAGFDMRYYDKLFGVFQRLHGTDEFEGSGVGLANVQRIIQKHGGNIEAKGVPGQGAIFEFELPKE